MRYRRNAKLFVSDVSELLRERGIPVIPQALDVGDLDAEAIRLGDAVELAELPDGTFMVSVNQGRSNWKLEDVAFKLDDAVDCAVRCYEQAPREMRANGERHRGAKYVKVVISGGPPWKARVIDSNGHVRLGVDHPSDKKYVERKVEEFWPELPVEYEMRANAGRSYWDGPTPEEKSAQERLSRRFHARIIVAGGVEYEVMSTSIWHDPFRNSIKYSLRLATKRGREVHASVSDPGSDSIQVQKGSTHKYIGGPLEFVSRPPGWKSTGDSLDGSDGRPDRISLFSKGPKFRFFDGEDHQVGPEHPSVEAALEWAPDRGWGELRRNAPKRCWGKQQRGVYITPRGKRIIVAQLGTRFRFFYEDTDEQVGEEVSYLRGVMEYAHSKGWQSEDDHKLRKFNAARYGERDESLRGKRAEQPSARLYSAADVLAAARDVPRGERHRGQVFITDIVALLPGLTPQQLLRMHRGDQVALEHVDDQDSLPGDQLWKVDDSAIDDDGEWLHVVKVGQ